MRACFIVASSNGNPKERRSFTTIAQQHYKALFKKALLQFITEPDPFLAMLKWVMTEMMRAEVEAKVGAPKGKHSKDRITHSSGGRARREEVYVIDAHTYYPRSGGGIFQRPQRGILHAR